ncbi:hypothetical protein [Pelagovum pacificum]|uniref:Uncharacterized protein n=1 Tax=Pelagovum pacificum TaxID=2588711 RepID=A0A5C5GHF3_9RHOB|nr:hypothetical protein [Pelagovum pacificum]QQA43995.1 hypothetical protein I8N54_05300 [Pelagovum pacificum]TNY32876.1 hypothetical protein FHY64_06260 [Pelagovum pacificum]
MSAPERQTAWLRLVRGGAALWVVLVLLTLTAPTGTITIVTIVYSVVMVVLCMVAALLIARPAEPGTPGESLRNHAAMILILILAGNAFFGSQLSRTGAAPEEQTQ